jgi:DNA-binding transcriptional ArsR family regulator
MYFTHMLINQIVKYQSPSDMLNAVFLALADPTRRGILERLSRGDATVNDIAKPFALSLPAISRHLKVLERAGLISRARHAQQRPCRLEVQTLKEGAEYMNQYRALWEDSLGNLDDYLSKLQTDRKSDEGDQE